MEVQPQKQQSKVSSFSLRGHLIATGRNHHHSVESKQRNLVYLNSMLVTIEDKAIAT